jgi:microcystin-dependent protein
LGQGYVRNDTSNNISDAGVINASDLDGEFDALLAAFVAATGHTHDGTAAEGGVVTVVGPAQDFVGGAGDFSPKTDSAYDLGKTAVRWATGYIDDLDVTTNIVVGGTVDGRDVAADGTKLDGVEALADVTDATNVTAAGALMDSELTAISSVKALDQGVATTDTPTFAGVVTSGNVDGRDVSVDGTKLDTIEASADVTDTTNVTAAGALMDSEVDADIKTLVLPASTTISTFGASLIDDADAEAALVTLGVTSFPSGGIVMWSGSVASIPAGWLICDGTSSTPDLRNRFVVGAGSTYAVAATGGAATVALSTAQMPAHTHTFSGTTNTEGAHTHSVDSNLDTTDGGNAASKTGKASDSSFTTNSAGAHNHTVSGTTASQGSGSTHENLPPYYALAYIMKS